MPLFRGVGPRIAKRLIELKYVRTDGKPDVRRFCLERGYDKTLVYYWLADRSTPMKELQRLAKDLKVEPHVLLFGDLHGARGLLLPLLMGLSLAFAASVQSPAYAQDLGQAVTPQIHSGNGLRLIGTWLRRWLYKYWTPSVHLLDGLTGA